MQIRPGQFQFHGSPEAIAAASQAHNAYMGAQAQTNMANAQAAAAKTGALGNVLGTIYQQPGQFANAIGQIGSAAAQGMTGVGAGYAGLGQGYGSVAQAIGNERSNFYGANAMAEAARQAGLANANTGAMAAYGGAANNALQAQAMQSTAYMKALSDMMAANQGAVSGLGRAQVVAGALPGGGFTATGRGGPIASGGMGGGGVLGGAGALSALSSGDRAYREQLERGLTSQAGVPGQTLADVLSGVQDLYSRGAGDMGAGMNQFYGAQNDFRNRGDYSGVLGGLAGLGSRLGSLRQQMSSDGGALDALRSLWNNSMGRVGAFAGGPKLSDADFF